MIAVAQFIGLPLLFFSSLLIARELIPSWMQDLSLLNPVEWAVRAARGEALPGTDWGDMGVFLLLLAAFAALTRRSRRSLPYQRTPDAMIVAIRPQPDVSDAPGDRRGTGALPGRDSRRLGRDRQHRGKRARRGVRRVAAARHAIP
jgi:hypothetical protein